MINQYQYTIYSKIEEVVVCEKTSNIETIKPLVSEALYDYIFSESKSGRLNARSFEDDRTICSVNKTFLKNVS